MTIVDSNVILDLLGGGPAWADWSVGRLEEARARDGVAVNAVIYAEIAPRFDAPEILDSFLEEAGFAMLDFSRQQLFAAGRAHRSYRRGGGPRDRVLPDFLIGAQAAATGQSILTRDPRRYRGYFPEVRLITP